MQLVDTHCHIHEIADDTDGEVHSVVAKWHQAGVTDADAVLARAQAVGVTRLICVGCTVHDSQLAVDFVQPRDACQASIGIHPHEAGRYIHNAAALAQFKKLATAPKVVAVGECGLDYFYNHSSKTDQAAMLHLQIELALQHDLPMIFHVREAFADFWPIFDTYTGIRGVIHSFNAGIGELEQILRRGLYVGLNGIMTFTKQDKQLVAAKAVPSDRLLLETDAPFLTPQPFRGSICEPSHVRVTAEFLAGLRGGSLTDLASSSTRNACTLFDW